MENSDKIYEQFKNAAQKAEQKDYPDMDKVWSRVEDKLDKKILTKENHLWKKIAVAASVILVVTLAFLVWSPKSEIETNQIITKSTETTQPELQEDIVDQTANPEIRTDAAEILEEKIVKQDAIAVSNEPAPAVVPVIVSDSAEERNRKKPVMERRTSNFKKARVFDAVGVQPSEVGAAPVAIEEQTQDKDSHLLVVDGKAITESEKAKMSHAAKQMLTDPKNETEFVLLKEPLYIINGVSYSEEELFGPNPTSPYAPLNKQEIETISILQDEQATAIYGERGRKGVVIITTKNKKPLDAKERK